MERNTTQLRKELRKKIPKEWFIPKNSYGFLIILSIWTPLFFAIFFTPYLYEFMGKGSFPLFIVCVGTFLYKFQFILHDCSHNSLFKHHFLNNLVGHISGVLTGANYKVYKYTHSLHHCYTGKILDPQYEDYLHGKQINAKEYLIFILSPLIGGRLLSFMKRELGTIFQYFNKKILKKNEYLHSSPQISLLWVINTLAVQIIIAFIITDKWKIPELALIYPLGAILIALFLSRFRTLAEHQPDIMQTEAIDFTRSHKKNFVDNLFFYSANFNYHLEHHLFPSMPSCFLHLVYHKYGEAIHSPQSLGESMVKTVYSQFTQRIKNNEADLNNPADMPSLPR